MKRVCQACISLVECWGGGAQHLPLLSPHEAKSVRPPIIQPAGACAAADIISASSGATPGERQLSTFDDFDRGETLWRDTGEEGDIEMGNEVQRARELLHAQAQYYGWTTVSAPR